MRGPLHHLDLNVKDLAESKPVYALLLGYLGYRLVKDHPEMCEWDLEASGIFCSIGLRQARDDGAAHDRYAPGLHHLAFHALNRADVDRFHTLLIEGGFAILDPPTDYPEYRPGYYALFFSDPDGIKLELVHTPGQ